MKGIIYELQVTMSSLDLSHNNYTHIKEVYIPKIKIAFNSKGYAFETDRSRYSKHRVTKNFPQQPNPEKIKEIDITSEDVALLLEIVHKRKTINRLSKKFFDIEPYKDDK